MSLVENRSDGDRIPPPVHAVVVIFVHDAFQRLNRTDGFSLILVAKFIIPLDSSFFGHVVLQNGDADVPQAINLPEDRIQDHSSRHILGKCQILKTLRLIQL